MFNSNDSRKIRVVGYCRSNGGDGIESQVKSIREFIDNTNSMELQNIFTDCKASGHDLNRTGYLQMMDAIQNQRAEMVVCSDVTRIHRNAVELRTFFRILREIGVSCTFLNNPSMTTHDYMELLNPVLIQGGEVNAEDSI